MDQNLKEELREIKTELREIRGFMKEIDMDLHMLRKSYIEKLQKIKKEGVVSEKEFKKELGIEF